MAAVNSTGIIVGLPPPLHLLPGDGRIFPARVKPYKRIRMNELSDVTGASSPRQKGKETQNPMTCENPNSNPKHTILKRIVRRLRAAGRCLCSGRDAAPRQLAIVIPLPDEIAHEVVKLQFSILRQYGTHEGLESQPHITLKMGFPATDIASAVTFLEQQAARMTSITLEIDGFDTFDEGILFLDVKPNSALEILRQGLLSDLKSALGFTPLPIEGPGFRFHVTVAAGLPAREFARLRDEFKARRMSFQFMARHMDLICHTGAHWVLCRRLWLATTDERS
jgi:2'-5' RNA ligase